MQPYKAAGAVISQQQAALADRVYTRQRQIQPELNERYDATGHQKSLRDTGYHLSYLAEALMAARPVLFVDYITWAHSVLKEYNVPGDHLTQNLVAMQHVLQKTLPAELYPAVDDLLSNAIEQLEQPPPSPPAFIHEGAKHSRLAQEYLSALLAGDRRQATTLIMDAVEASVPIREIYLHVFQPAQYEIGRLWQTNQISVAHEHFATAATQMIISQLYPYIFESPRNGRRLVATCVNDDLHELGIRMVADFFEMDGWDTFYLGANTPAGSIIRMLEETGAELLAISATMTLNVSRVTRLIEQIRAASSVKIMVGGYPFNISKDLWQEVGADGYAPHAEEALATAARLTG
ncbi:MAG: cobalamin-dependent protein [Anaerolineae bacterium]|nr:cobalamin-dependent protein [Anaerolineae bacterium]